MKCSLEPIRFHRRPSDIRLAPASSSDGLASWADREKAAFERGKQEGEKVLREQLLKQRAELLEIQNGLFQSLRQALPQVTRDCETALIELALSVANRLVSNLPITAEMVEGAIKEALARVEESSDITVLLNPEDLELLQKLNSPLLAPTLGGERMRWHGSAEVTRGGCMVQTRFGTIDGRRETKLEMLRKSMEES